MSKKVIKRYFQDKSLISIAALILLGSITWCLTMIKSGLVYSFGMGFWGPNGHDGVWHISLINHLAKGDLGMPIFAGEMLKNYHLGFDLLLAIIHKITTIPAHTLYFQIVPPILALLTGILTYKFVYLWRKSRIEAFWATFFVYFGGSFGWMVTLLRSGQIGGESLFWSQQAVSTLVNPPFALSIVMMLLGLISIIRAPKKKYGLFLPILIFGILAQVKIYAGVLSLGALFVAGIYELLRKRKTVILKIFAGAAFISGLMFFFFSRGSANLIVFKPFWFLETMMGLSDRFNWPRFYEAMVNYRLGGIWFKAIPAYIIAFLIFWYGNMGTRFIQEILFAKWILEYKKHSFIEIFLVSVIFAGGVIPLFFLQAGTPWNTIQFFYYSLVFSGIIAGVVLGEYLKKKKSFVMVGAFVLLTVPTTISTLKDHYLPARPPAKISNEELEALEFLSIQPDGITLTYPFDRVAAEAARANPPRPLYLYESTAYVSAFGKKSVYLEDEVNLNITGYEWKERREEIESFLESLDDEYVYDFLRENDISYIYWIKGQRAKKGESQLGIERIFENSEVDIYKVN